MHRAAARRIGRQAADPLCGCNWNRVLGFLIIFKYNIPPNPILIKAPVLRLQGNPSMRQETQVQRGGPFPKGPCSQIVDTFARKYPNRDYFKANVSTSWVHGPFEFVRQQRLH